MNTVMPDLCISCDGMAWPYLSGVCSRPKQEALPSCSVCIQLADKEARSGRRPSVAAWPRQLGARSLLYSASGFSLSLGFRV